MTTATSESNNSNSNDNEWKVVTTSQEKKKRGHYYARKPQRGKGQKYANDSATSWSSITATTSELHDAAVLSQTLSACMASLKTTYFWKRLGREMTRINDDPSCGAVDSTILNTTNSNSNSNHFPPAPRRRRVSQIVAYGIGNFSKTSSVHFSASLWQLACLLTLRDHCSDNQQQQQKETITTGENSTSTTTKSSKNNDSQYHHNSIPIYFYDPCSTNFEFEFLSETQKDLHVLRVNERGKRIFTSRSNEQKCSTNNSINNYDDSNNGNDSSNKKSLNDTDKDEKRGGTHEEEEEADELTTTLFFMPHCPRKLYENVLVAHWNDLLSTYDDNDGKEQIVGGDSDHDCRHRKHSEVCLIGNSLVKYAEALATNGTTEKSNSQVLEMLVPFIRQVDLNHDGASATTSTTTKSSKMKNKAGTSSINNDDETAPGYFVSAFNDTYVTTFHLPHHGSLWPSCPCSFNERERKDNDDDDDYDDELL